MSDPSYGPSAIATPANYVTMLRILVSPLLFAMISDNPSGWLVWALWTALALTDGVDGWIARRHGTTRSGAFLDPLADKVLVLGALYVVAALVILAEWRSGRVPDRRSEVDLSPPALLRRYAGLVVRRRARVVLCVVFLDSTSLTRRPICARAPAWCC